MRRCAKVRKRRPDRLSKLLLCDLVIPPLENHLRTTGLEHREEAGLLAGYIIGKSFGIATTALLPYTNNMAAACSLPLDVTMNCVDAMNRAGQIVLAQVHTHPGRVCGHSATDNQWAFSDCPGLISIVVPCFGRYGMQHLFNGGTAVHERLVTGKWRRLPPTEVRQRIFVIPSRRVVL
jgi:proteasome lid subunit RPN8/RPN11